WLTTMRRAPPRRPASQPVARDTPLLYSGPKGANDAVVIGSMSAPAGPAPEPSWASGANKENANTLTSAKRPGPGAVTMLLRPVEKATKAVAGLTADWSCG